MHQLQHDVHVITNLMTVCTVALIIITMCVFAIASEITKEK